MCLISLFNHCIVSQLSSSWHRVVGCSAFMCCCSLPGPFSVGEAFQLYIIPFSLLKLYIKTRRILANFSSLEHGKKKIAQYILSSAYTEILALLECSYKSTVNVSHQEGSTR